MLFRGSRAEAVGMFAEHESANKPVKLFSPTGVLSKTTAPKEIGPLTDLLLALRGLGLPPAEAKALAADAQKALGPGADLDALLRECLKQRR